MSAEFRSESYSKCGARFSVDENSNISTAQTLTCTLACEKGKRKEKERGQKDTMPTQHRILALLYSDFEALDLFGPLGAIVPRSDYYSVKLVNIHDQSAPNGLESSIKNDIGIVPNLSLAESLKEEEQFETLFIPGGQGMRSLVWDSILLRQIGQLVDRAASVFTVCTGSILLAATGRLDGRKATTNKRVYDQMTPKCTCSLVTTVALSVDFSFRSWRPVAKACSLGGRRQIFDLVGDHGRY